MASLDTIGGLHYEMMRRCYNEKSVAYKDYGAKGISVCEEWHDREMFREWAKNNGYVKGLRLERIDSKGNYEPGNCRFGTLSVKREDSWISTVRRKRKQKKEKLDELGLDKNYCDLRIYGIYIGMKVRCNNPKDKRYVDYGGRGINVCNEWSGRGGFFEFYKWAIENGYNDSLTIERDDVNGDYEPGNCRWIPLAEQSKNRRNTRRFFHNGKEMVLSEIAREENIAYGKLYGRVVRKGMSIEEAIKKKSAI